MSHSETAIQEALDDLLVDPMSFAEFANLWAMQGYPTAPDESIDSVAKELESMQIKQSDSEHISSFVQLSPSAALIIDEKGAIKDLNREARDVLALKPGDSFWRCSLELMESETLENAQFQAKTNRGDLGEPVFKQAYLTTEENPILISFCAIPGNEFRPSLTLVSFIKNAPKFCLDGAFKDIFKLTPAEVQVLNLFFEGHDIEEISKIRCSSSATVRTQLNTIRSKVGAPSQVDLFRTISSLSSHLERIDALRMSGFGLSGRRHSVLRPNGRCVDVTLAGDDAGKPIVFVPGNFFQMFPGTIEREFAKRGFALYTIARPGFGGTSPSHNVGTDDYAEDVLAVMNQLGHDQFILIAHTTGVPAAFRLCETAKERVESLVLLGLFPPKSVDEKAATKSRWHDAIVQAARTNPKLTELLARSGRRLLMSMGTKLFLRSLYKGSKADLKVVKKEEFIKMYEASIKIVEKQGIKAPLADAIETANDWSSMIHAMPQRILIFHGVEDPHCPIDRVRRFAELQPNAELFEVANAGHFACISAIGPLLDKLQNVATCSTSLNRGNKEEVAKI